MKQVKGGVTAAKGFEAASTAAGIKYKDRKDMAMIFSKTPCDVAGTFTTNLVKAAPVKWDQEVVANSKCAHAVVVMPELQMPAPVMREWVIARKLLIVRQNF